MARVEQLVIPYDPRPQFLPLHSRKQRWAVVVAHRRAGKTVACINDLIRGAFCCPHPNARFAYVAPYFSQAKDVAWEYLKEYARPVLASAPNESELRVDLINGARIRLYGADNPDRLRGLYLDGVILDEYADMRPSVWGEIIRPMLSDRQGWATFIGTPKGRNEFFEKWQQAERGDDWLALMLKASETGLVAQRELDDAAATMTPEQYAQEYECSFDAAIIGAYYGKEIAEAERAGRIVTVEREPSLATHTVWDLGIGDSTAIFVFQVHRNELRVIDHYENAGFGLQHYCEWLDERGYSGGDDWLPHDARVRDLSTGRTRVETLKAMGRNPRLVPQHKIEDGINALRVLFPVVWWDHERCSEAVEALRQYRREFDEKTKAFRDRPRHDWTSHTADAARYMAMAYRAVAPQAERDKRGKFMTVGPSNKVTLNDVIKPLHAPPQRERI